MFLCKLLSKADYTALAKLFILRVANKRGLAINRKSHGYIKNIKVDRSRCTIILKNSTHLNAGYS